MHADYGEKYPDSFDHEMPKEVAYIGSKRLTDRVTIEGVEGFVRAKGSAKDILFQLVGGLKSGMGYIGAPKIADMPKCAEFVS